ncbi:hypothetical protein [Polaribacter aquimarinus]|uniref:Group-specific protein n=1 Tax=Polaribacter aquimarinus TaxID=2100726 RepID=A0A2U2JCR1_9FLAO|nr:hypothetical protein [Polaribacter aquimarinus]PWG06128.1 hypothetical protein DIS07_06770 [Polaribacter aquimarinus]
MKKWVKVGLIWGIIMFVIMTFIFPYFDKEEITTKRILLGIIIWTIAGLFFGFSMRKNFKR